jgi:hypothetical protein
MGTIQRIGRLRVYMLAGDHQPPHVHISSADGDVCVLLTDGAVIGSRKAQAACREATEWVLLNAGELLDKWRRLNG